MGRLVPFIVIIFILLGILVSVPLLLRPDSHRAQLAQYLSDQLHHKVVIGKLDAVFFPPALRISDIAVMHDQGETPIARAERLDVTPDWASLFKGKIRPSALSFNHLTVTMARRQDGSWDSDEWLGGVPAPADAPSWPLTTVTVHQGEVHWLDSFAEPSQELVLQQIEATLDRGKRQLKWTGALNGLGAPVSIEFTGQGTFPSDWAGDAMLTDQNRKWALHVTDQRGALDAKGQAAEWRAGALWSLIGFYGRWKPAAAAGATEVLTQWKNHFSFAPHLATFYEAGNLAGGETEVKGEETSSGTARSLALSVALKDVSAESIANITGESLPVDGKLTTVSHLEFPVAAHPLGTFSGEGTVVVRDGHFHFPEASVKSLEKAKTKKYLSAKYPGWAESGLPLSQLRLHYLAKQGNIQIDEGSLVSGDLRAALVGKIDGAHEAMDAYTRLQIREKNPELLKELPAHYVYGAPGHETIQPIYGRIQGTWTDWSLRAVKSSSIPGAVQAKLRRAIGG